MTTEIFSRRGRVPAVMSLMVIGVAAFLAVATVASPLHSMAKGNASVNENGSNTRQLATSGTNGAAYPPHQLADLKAELKVLKQMTEELFKAVALTDPTDEDMRKINALAMALSTLMENASEALTEDKRLAVAIGMDVAKKKLTVMLTKLRPSPGPGLSALLSSLEELETALKKADAKQTALEDGIKESKNEEEKARATLIKEAKDRAAKATNVVDQASQTPKKRAGA